MKILNLIMLAFVFLMLNAASCTKDAGKLPNKTHEGKKKLVVYVNEIVLLNKGQPLWSVKI